MVTLVYLRAYWRFFVVLYQFFPLIVAYLRDRRRFLVFGPSRTVSREMQLERAEVLLDSLLTLGPTFIKLGQLLSTRPDVLPPAYIDVLSRLQDEVPPAPWPDAEAVLEAELGPVEEVFDEFDTDAISGASLGQVYRATYEGEAVAVKVRRPGIEELVSADLRAIRWLLPLLMRFIGETRAFSLENLADEFGRVIREEMDYGREALMLNEIRDNFADDDRVRIPPTVDAVCEDRVLTMEYVPGVKISRVDELDAAGLDRHELAVTLDRAYLQMIVVDGVFHADPHPGNLAVQEDGTIVFYDFGMSGRVDPYIQDSIVDFYVAVANQNIDAILDTLIDMGTLSPTADREVMGQVMELAIANARGEDIEHYRVQQIFEQVESTIYEFPLRLPRNLALVLRVATVVEGVCVTLDQDFDFIAVATDYLREQGYMEETARQVIESAGDQVRQSTRALVTVPPKLDRFLDEVDRGNVAVTARIEDENDVYRSLAKRLVFGFLLGVGVLSVVILYAFTSLVAAGVAAVGTAGVGALLYLSFRERRGIRTPPEAATRGFGRRRRE